MIRGAALACIAAALACAPAFAADTLFHRALAALQGNEAEAMPPPAAMELAFSPGGGATDLVVKAIEAAHKSIHVAAYAFTSRPIADALIAARRAGVDVRIVMDHEEVSRRRHSVAPVLVAAGIPLRVDIVHELLHDKYMIIDGRDVETGSFNYTAGAEQYNAENVLVLWDDPRLATAYESDWQNLWDKAESYGGQ